MEFANIIKMMKRIKSQALKCDCYKLDQLKEEYVLLYKMVIHPYIYNEEYERDPDTGYDTLASEKEYMDHLSNQIFELVA